jgi:uncharacterized protein (UPF0333 family)
MSLKRKKELGQTSLEYLLLLVVSAGIGMTFFKKFSGYLVDNPDSLIAGYIGGYKRILNSQQNFKRYYVPK